MNILLIIQIIGVLSIFLLFALIFFMALNKKVSSQSLRTVMLWTAIYIFFLFVLRFMLFLHIGTREQLTLISNLTSPIPIIIVLIQLFLEKKMK